MYVPGTILTLKVQKDPDPETKEEYAYNRIKYVNVSPVTDPPTDWEGEDAKHGIYVPLSNFAGNLLQPFGRIRALYDIESIPEEPGGVEEEPIKSVEEQLEERKAKLAAKIEASRTPEDVFKEKAPSKPRAPRESEDPLDEVIPPKAVDPLGEAPKTRKAPAKK